MNKLKLEVGFDELSIDELLRREPKLFDYVSIEASAFFKHIQDTSSRRRLCLELTSSPEEANGISLSRVELLRAFASFKRLSKGQNNSLVWHNPLKREPEIIVANISNGMCYVSTLDYGAFEDGTKEFFIKGVCDPA